MFMDFCNTLELSRTTTRSRSLSPHVQTRTVWHITAVRQPYALNVNRNASQIEVLEICDWERYWLIGDRCPAMQCWSNKHGHQNAIFIVVPHVSYILFTYLYLIIMQLIYDATQSGTCSFLLASRALWHVHFAEQQCGLALWPDC